MYDPPEHTVLRAPLNEAFSPRAMAARRETVRALAVELIDKIVPQGACDFFEAVAEPLPVLIFMGIVGLGKAHFREFRILAQTIVSEADALKRAEAGNEVSLKMQALIKERRGEPRDDLVSRLIKTEIGGRPLNDDELAGYCNLLFAAGLDSVANGMGFCVRYLAHDQALQQKLRDEPQLLVQGIEELLRRHAPAPVCRMITQDIEWHGVKMHKGDIWRGSRFSLCWRNCSAACQPSGLIPTSPRSCMAGR